MKFDDVGDNHVVSTAKEAVTAMAVGVLIERNNNMERNVKR